jgi:hypothetical protein
MGATSGGALFSTGTSRDLILLFHVRPAIRYINPESISNKLPVYFNINSEEYNDCFRTLPFLCVGSIVVTIIIIVAERK